jgi:acyl-CoA dehydrogenase
MAMLDFTLPAPVLALKARVRAFVEDAVIPREAEVARTPHRLEQVRAELQAAARTAGLFAPRVAPEYGGLGLDWRAAAIVFEEAGRSLLGPQALNCAAPDEGNMHLLHAVASAAQRERYLAPLSAGRVRSCFAMTEPSPGAGSDPAMLRTRARREGVGWVLEGDKRFISGAQGAAFAVVVARTDAGPTLFLVDADNPGWQVTRAPATLDHAFPGGHCEVALRECRVAEDAVLGEVGQGLAHAQLRLAGGRLTHCMRWLGLAARATDVAADYVRARESFGRPLADHQQVQRLIAESHIELHACRTMVWHAAWCLDTGQDARHETSMVKAFAAEALSRVVDRAVQLCGASGISEDLPLASFYREIRGFRIYDGATEVHLAAVGIRVLRKGLKGTP